MYEEYKIFLGKHVKVERKLPSDIRPFKYYGYLEKIVEDSGILILKGRSGLGTIRIQDVISIVEIEPNYPTKEVFGREG